jgi:peptidoglycan hydrolase-like protein with peptidoglycan-binding domain
MGSTRHTGRPALAAALLTAALALSGCGMVAIDSGDGDAVAQPTSTSQDPVPTSTTPDPDPSTDPTTDVPTSEPTTAAPTTTPTSTRTVTPPTPTAEPEPKEGDTLHVGDEGAYVRSVQQRLSALGYWNGVADGQYGQLTAQAVMALQKAAGLGRDGVVGPATAEALENGVVPRSRTGGTGVEIDKGRQLLLVVRGGTVTHVINTSTGSGETYTSYGQDRVATTPVGTYSTFRSVDRLDKGPLGDLWRPRYFNGGIAVHGSGSIPGHPASHGCARVSNGAMNMIWSANLMPIGGRVTVY